MPDSASPWLEPDEPSPVVEERLEGTSPFLLTVDHAGKRLPRRVGTLGISATELSRHIGWDIGILGVSRLLSARLDAAMVGQVYSRLVIDCNRDPSVPSSIPVLSETTEIPGNAGLGEAEREARRLALFEPYHARLRAVLDARADRETVLISMHSFTPVFKGVARPWQVGVLYNRDTRLAHILRDLLAAEGDLTVGDNEPYQVSDLTDYTVPVHAERRGLAHVEIEIRQDLIEGEPGQAAWADRFARLLPEALRAFHQRNP